MEIKDKIDEGYEAEPPKKPRDYIGAANVGHQCEALLAFSLRGFPETPPAPRTKRIFALGHLLEKQIIKDLKDKADIRVWEKDGLTNRQYHYELFGGHVSCHLDGHIELDDGEIAVLEVKTMGDRPFKNFVKKGVASSHPQYFAQCQLMMGMGGFQKSVLLAYSKNTSEYHSEIIEYDELEYSHLIFRAEQVMDNEAEKIAKDEEDWRCRGCFKFGVCWGDDEVPERCQTCAHAVAIDTGEWHCGVHNKPAVKLCSRYDRYRPRERGY